MRRLYPLPVEQLAPEQWQQAYAFPQSPWVRGSMAASLDGAIAGADGKSGSISSPADRRLFPALRQGADVVLVGAGTVRDEMYSPSSLQMAIVSNRLNLSTSIPLIGDRQADAPLPLVFTTQRALQTADPDLAGATELIACGADEVDLEVVMATLTGRGLGRVHCEGGPNLLSDLARAGLLDEVLLTITPRLVGAVQHVVNTAETLGIGLTLTQVLEDEGSVFIRASRVAE